MTMLLLGIIYLSFISLGLPDSLLGAAWPAMCLEFAVPVSWAGAISLITSGGTILSSLLSDRLTRRFGTGLVTAVSVSMTAVALLGFSFADRYWMMLLWAVPCGLGAGGVDAALNNYVALHYASRHMSWLHCMWGVGATAGPYIMSYALTGGQGWNMGYRYIAFIQIALVIVLYMSIPLWRKRSAAPDEKEGTGKALGLGQILAIPGAKEILIAFFCYCALESTAILWGGTYLVGHLGMGEEEAAFFASLFFIGMTLGRAGNGFLTYKISDKNLIRLGAGIIVLGVAIMLLPLGVTGTVFGLLLIGLGCAPVYPCIIHSTPEHFGPENSQALIGVQMASAYMGTLTMPPLFGLIADFADVSLMPVFIGILTVLMILMCEKLNRKH